ncbi:MAG TPA: hypothetical protein VJZ76_16725 [Thermoanaerobaculia bacterium]|nr:hypothetical protein [Thermoanaerobaculia bacterium]
MPSVLVIAALILGAMFVGPDGVAIASQPAGSVTFTLDCWDDAFNTGQGNNCDFCPGTIQPNHRFTYNCNEGTTNPWTPSCSFVDPSPSGTVVTSIKAVVVMIDCSGQRSYAFSRYNVLLNGQQFAPDRTSSLNNCGCGSAPGCLQEEFASSVAAQGLAGYAKDAQNTLTISVPAGAICVETMSVTVTYAPAPPVSLFGYTGLTLLALFLALAGVLMLRQIHIAR